MTSEQFDLLEEYYPQVDSKEMRILVPADSCKDQYGLVDQKLLQEQLDKGNYLEVRLDEIYLAQSPNFNTAISPYLKRAYRAAWSEMLNREPGEQFLVS